MIFSFSWHGIGDPNAEIEAATVATGRRDYTVIRIGHVTLFPTEEQTRGLCKALTAHVAELDAEMEAPQ